jgi:ribosome maturation factor RimP
MDAGIRGISSHLTAIVRSVVEPLGYELVGIEHHARNKQGSLLRIYIDKPDSAITLDDCALVSHQLSGVFDVEDPIPGQYQLEISSPGLDRPLFTVDQLMQFTGQQAHIRLRTKLNGQRHFKGLLAGIMGDNLRLDTDDGMRELPLDLIESARLIPPF